MRNPKVISQVSRMPETVPALINWLDTICPEPKPNPSDDLAKVMFEAGRRALVLQLKQEFERSTKTI